MNISCHSDQLDLLDADPFFAWGWTYCPEYDKARLKGSLQRVLWLLLDGQRHTTAEIRKVGGSAGDSRLRQLRDMYKLPIPAGERVKGAEVGGLYVYWLETHLLNESPGGDGMRPTHMETVCRILGLEERKG
jgi:hypothetical protein